MTRRLGRAFRRLADRLDPQPPPPASRDVGLRDAATHGWFDYGTGQLYPGVSVGSSDVVADIGCGDGGAATFCARRGAHLLLADVDAPRLEAARRRVDEIAPGRVEAVASDAAPLPFPDGVATRVVCTEVVEHVPDPAVLLAELARIAAPGALLLLSCPDPRSETVQKALAPDILFQHPNHIRVLPHEAFRALVENAGLIVERQDFYGFYWAVWWSFFWETGTDFMNGPLHPVLEGWARLWDQMLDFPAAKRIQGALDAALPKSQVIVARRPRALPLDSLGSRPQTPGFGAAGPNGVRGQSP